MRRYQPVQQPGFDEGHGGATGTRESGGGRRAMHEEGPNVHICDLWA